jgi:hypothetical protein
MNPSKQLRNLCHLLLAGSALLQSTVGAAPARADESDTQQWTIFTVEKDLSPRWRGYFEIQPRIGGDISKLDRLIIRPALGYRVNSKLSLWQGYGWTPAFEPEFNDEHRLYQQVLFEDKLGKTSFSSRTRLEERFIEGAGSTSVRLRSMIRFMHPLSTDRKWAAVAYDELFFNLTSSSPGPVAGFDQNRLFLGVSRQLNEQLRVETGYLMNHVNVPRTSENRRNDVWLVWFAYRP